MRAGGDRGRGRPHAASVTRAQARGGGARAALAAKRRLGARGREEMEEGERERKGEERFTAMIATGGEEKERRVRSAFEIG